MTIRNKDKFGEWLPAGFDGQFHWDFLFPAFRVPFTDGNGMSPAFQPMDIDSVVERKGHLIIFETKEPGKAIDKGQQITLQTIWRKGATIVHLSGKSPIDICGMAVYGEREPDKTIPVGSKPLVPCDFTDVVFLMRQWMCWVNEDPIPRREDWENDWWNWSSATKLEAG